MKVLVVFMYLTKLGDNLFSVYIPIKYVECDFSRVQEVIHEEPLYNRNDLNVTFLVMMKTNQKFMDLTGRDF